MAESMKDFETELEQSFQVIKEGDVLEVEVIGISETELTVDLNYYTEGIIPLEECSDDPAFSIKNDCNIGDRIQAMVIDAENENGVVILSKKAAHNLMIWDELEEDYQNRTVFQVKITDTTSGGIIGYVKGVRAFIPASKIELNYVEDTSGYLGMTLEAMIITVDKEAKRLVLSAKEIQKERKAKEYVQKVGQLTVGDVVTGTVDRIESYGVFITIGEDLTGLCHISQITNKFIKSPKEIVKLGDTVTAQIIKLEGDRVSLSMKALTEDEVPKEEDDYEIPKEFQADHEEDADASPFAALLKGIMDAALDASASPLLCFVDEVLRGTNTVERIAASTQILHQLSIRRGVYCFAATHDIELTHLLDGDYDNYHFEEDVKDHDVLFSYHLMSGRAQSRNAIKLLEVIGFTQDITQKSQEMAECFIKTGKWEDSYVR